MIDDLLIFIIIKRRYLLDDLDYVGYRIARVPRGSGLPYYNAISTVPSRTHNTIIVRVSTR